MATSIATGVLKPNVAVAISAVLNLVGAFLSIEVAKTISGGIVEDTKVTPVIVFAGLVAVLGTFLVYKITCFGPGGRGVEGVQDGAGAFGFARFAGARDE